MRVQVPPVTLVRSAEQVAVAYPAPTAAQPRRPERGLPGTATQREQSSLAALGKAYAPAGSHDATCPACSRGSDRWDRMYESRALVPSG